jgi:flagellar biosynthesis anti-sigma factor FlgM
MDFKVVPIQIASMNPYTKEISGKNQTVRPRAEADKLEVSDSAALFAKALAEAQALPEVRADLVSEVKTAINSGTYVIDSRVIAERILSK